MPDLWEAVIAVTAMLGLLFVSDAFFGAGDPRFDNAYYDSAFYAPHSKEFRFASDVTPAARVDDMFAQFFPSEAKRTKRYSSLTTIIR